MQPTRTDEFPAFTQSERIDAGGRRGIGKFKRAGFLDVHISFALHCLYFSRMFSDFNTHTLTDARDVFGTRHAAR